MRPSFGIVGILIVLPALLARAQEPATRPAPESRSAIPTMVVRGRVVDSTGLPISHATVTLPRLRQRQGGRLLAPPRLPETPPCLCPQPDEREPRRTVPVDDLGRFEAEVARGSYGSYGICADAPGYARGYPSVDSSNPPELEIVLAKGASIRGRVIDAATGAAIPEAEIGWYEFHTRSPSDGSFVLDGLPSKTGLLVAAHPDFVHQRLPKMEPDPAKPRELTIALDPGETVTGRIVDSKTGAPVGRCVVAAVSAEDRENCKRALADESGRFELKGLKPGKLNFGISAPDHVERHFERRIEKRKRPQTLGDIRIDPGIAVKLRVVDDRGAPVEGAGLQSGAVVASTDSEGVAMMDGIPPSGERPVSVKILAIGFEPMEWSSPTAASRSSEAEVRLTRATGVLAGRVVDDEGRPIKEANVSAYNWASNLDLQSATDPEGRFRLEGVSAGNWDVSASERDHQNRDVRPTVRVEKGSRHDTDFVLVRVFHVSGRVQSPDGRTIPATITRAKGHAPPRIRESMASLARDGSFLLAIPKADPSGLVHFSALGFQSKDVAIEDLQGGKKLIVLDPLADAASIRGVVVDAATHAPLKGAHVSISSMDGGQRGAWDDDRALERQLVVTSEDGAFHLTAPLGNLRVKVETSRIAGSRPYVDLVRSVVLTRANEEVPVTLEVTSGGSLVVTFLPPPSGAEAIGGTLRRGDEARPIEGTYAKELGALLFVGLQPGNYQLAITLTGEPSRVTQPLGALRDAIVIKDNERRSLEVGLDPMGTLAMSWTAATQPTESRPRAARIELISMEDRPVDLWFTEPGWRLMSSTSFDSEAGTVLRRRLPPGSYRLRFDHPSLDAPEQIVVIRAAEETAVELVPRTRGK